MNQALRIKRAVEKARREFINQTEKHIKTVLSNYELALNDITQTLSNIDTTIDSFSTQRLIELQNHLTQRINQIKTTRDKQVVDALNDAGKSGFDTQMLQREIMGKAPLGISWDFFVPRGVEYYQSFALQLCDQYDQELVNAIQQRLRLGFMERKSWSELITDIRRNAFGFKKYQRVDRKDKGASWKIKRMVRTETQRMRTMAEEEVIRQDPDVIGIYFYFGGGPCDGSCEKLVGEYYKDGSGKGWPPPSIPIHPNCTCYTTNIYPEIKYYVQNLVKTETETEVPEYVREIRELVNKGIKDYKDVMNVGEVMYREVDKRFSESKKLQKLLSQMDEIEKEAKRLMSEWRTLERQLNKAIDTGDTEKYRMLERSLDRVEEEQRKLRKKLFNTEKNVRIEKSNIFKSVLREVRQIGSDVEHFFALGTSKKAQKAYLEAINNLPKEWVEKSAEQPITVIAKRGRAYYNREKAIMVLGTENTFSTACHEIGHRVEKVVDGVTDLERQFYNARTAGHSAKIIPGTTNELYKPNDWADPYVGRYYEFDAYEILSTGLETLLDGKRDIIDAWKDPEQIKFVMGLLGGL